MISILKAALGLRGALMYFLEECATYLEVLCVPVDTGFLRDLGLTFIFLFFLGLTFKNMLIDFWFFFELFILR